MHIYQAYIRQLGYVESTPWHLLTQFPSFSNLGDDAILPCILLPCAQQTLAFRTGLLGFFRKPKMYVSLSFPLLFFLFLF